MEPPHNSIFESPGQWSLVTDRFDVSEYLKRFKSVRVTFGTEDPVEQFGGKIESA
jgi:hypothetical protein